MEVSTNKSINLSLWNFTIGSSKSIAILVLLTSSIFMLSLEINGPIFFALTTALILSHAYRLYFFSIQDSNRRFNLSSNTQTTPFFLRTWWWIPVLNWNWILISFIYLSVYNLWGRTEVNLAEFITGYPLAKEIVNGLISPDLSLLQSAVFHYARQTIDIALLGTFFGFLISIPLSFICSRNLMSSSSFLYSIHVICRFVMVVIRSIPTFLLGLIFVALVGLGPFPGVLAITIFSTGVMVKLFSETIEAVDDGISESIETSGGSWINVIRFSVIPQIKPSILAQLLYCTEINIHSATVLGLIGAEGIGLPIHEYLSSLAYEKSGTFILVTIVMTVVVDFASSYIRKRMK